MKRFLSLVLCILMVLPAKNVIAEEEVLNISENETSVEFLFEEPNYISLKQIALSMDGALLKEENKITLNYQNENYIFDLDSQTFLKPDGTSHLMSKPIEFLGDEPYVFYDYVSFLYEDEKELYSDTKKRAVSLIYEYMRDYDIPGLTVAFVDPDNNYTWTEGFGYSDVSLNSPVTEKTVFDTGELAQTFTAVSVLKLWEKGLIDLNENLNTYLPDFSIKVNPENRGNFKDITVDMLLEHRSGLPFSYFDRNFSLYSQQDYYMNNILANLKNNYMSDVPGKRYTYSDVGYAVLGNIVSEVSGNSENVYNGFSSYMNNNVFLPMGMNSSGFILTEELRKLKASSYLTVSTGVVDDVFNNNISSGSFFTNAEDMAKFLKFMLVGNQKVLNTETQELFFEFPKTDNDVERIVSYGKGLYKINAYNQEFIGNDGSGAIQNGRFMISKKNNTGIFVASNGATSQSVVYDLCLKIINTANTEKAENNGKLLSYDYTLREPVVLTESNIKSLEGYYTNLGKLEVRDGNLYLKDSDNLFVGKSGGSFEHPYVGKIYFEDYDNKTFILYGEDREFIISQKIYPKEASNNFRSLIGDYEAITSQNEYPVCKYFKLTMDDRGFPILEIESSEYSDSHILNLEEIDKNRYYILGVSQFYGGFIEVEEKNGERIIKYNGASYKLAEE